MENLTLAELFSGAIKLNPHDKNYAIPGVYDVKLIDSVWILSTALLFFTIQTGLAFLEMGIVEPKNYTNVLMKHFVDVCCGGFAYWMWGFGLMYGRGKYSNGFFGFGDFIVNTETNDPLSGQVLSFFFYQMAFCSTASTIVSGTVTGRVKFKAYIPLSMGVVTIYSIGAGWIWSEHGFLKKIGVIDFAGTAPIHVLCGTCCLVVALYLGPRKGRFDLRNDPPPLSSPVYTCVGMFIIWWGWVAFNAGSSYGLTDGRFNSAARAGAGTMIASMCGGFTGIVGSMIRNKGKTAVIDVVGCILASLVAINAGCFIFSMYASAFVGFVASIIYLFSSRVIYKLKIDDVTDATAIHLICGIWGSLSVGLFADPPDSGTKSLFIDGSLFQLKVQLICVLCIIAWAGISIYLILFLIDLIVKIRPSETDELLGSDKTEHELNEDAYLLDSSTLQLAYSEGSGEVRYRKNFSNFNIYHPETPPTLNGNLRNGKRNSYNVTHKNSVNQRF